jgi:hypothetical protein
MCKVKKNCLCVWIPRCEYIWTGGGIAPHILNVGPRWTKMYEPSVRLIYAFKYPLVRTLYSSGTNFYRFCTLWVCVCVGFVMCVCFGNMCTCIYCVLYCLYCIFILISLCIVFFFLPFLWGPSAYASGSTSALWLIVLSPYLDVQTISTSSALPRPLSRESWICKP